MKRVAIIGAGIAGLALVEALRHQSDDDELEIVVLEKSDRAGGRVRSDRIDGYLCESGPSGFLDSAPETLALVRRIGIEDRLQASHEAARRRFIYRKGTLHQVPGSPSQFIRSGLMSWQGKMRLLLEPFAAKRPAEDETIRAFAVRRIGPEAADVLIDAMVSGIFAGDANELSLRACFPKMWELETEHGSLFRALLRLRRGKKGTGGIVSSTTTQTASVRGQRLDESVGTPTGRLTSFKEGMEDLVRGLVAVPGPAIQRHTRVTAIVERHSVPSPAQLPAQRRFLLQIQGDSPLEADAVVLAGPGAESAWVLQRLDPALAGELNKSTTAPLAVVCLGYDGSLLPVGRVLDGFGFLIPRGEGRRTLGALWESSIYPGRAPVGRALIRVLIGGARAPEAVELPEDELVKAVRNDLSATMGLDTPPVFVQVFRHRLGIPQYAVGHLERLRRLDELLQAHTGLFLTGDAYHGVGINACIAQAGPLADRILSSVRSGEPWWARRPVPRPSRRGAEAATLL